MPATYDAISTTTLTTTATSVSFSNVPQIYTDLLIIARYATSGTPLQFGISVRYNGDAGTNYSFKHYYGNGTITSTGQGNQVSSLIAYESYGSAVGIMEAHIFKYTAPIFKSHVSRSSNTTGTNFVGATTGTWQNTAPITAIQILSTDFGSGSTPFLSGSMFTLYGIKEA